MGFFVEQGYTGRTILDVVLFLLIVGFFAMLVIVWYHGEGGRQKVQRLEVVLLATCLAVALGGSAVVATRATDGRVAFEDRAMVDLGDRSVAVLPFENGLPDGSMAWLDRGIAELLATDLAQVDSLRVVGGQRIIDLMRQIGEGESRIVPEEQRSRVTRMAGARYMLSGRIAGSGDDVVLIASLVDARTGEIAAAARQQGSDIFAVVDAVSAQLVADAFGARAEPASGTASIADLTTTNLEAYAEYQRGREARFLFDFPEALVHFQRAVEIDSTFALAHFQLAGVQVQQGDFVGSAESLRLAREHLTHATERDRMFIEGLGTVIEGDIDGGEARLRELIRRYPDEKEARIVLASVKRGREGSSPEVAELIEETLRLDPLYTIGYNELAYTEVRRGNHDSALALIETYVRLEPGEPNPLDSRGEVLEQMGLHDRARESFRQALDLDPTFTIALRHLVASHLGQDDVPGALEELRPYAESGNPRVRMVARSLEAEAHFWRGDFEMGLVALRAAVDDPDPDPGQQVNSLRSLLFALLQLGRYDEALERAPRMAELTPLEGSAELVEIVSAGERGDVAGMSRASDRMVTKFRENPNVTQFLEVTIAMTEIWKAYYRGEHERVIELAAAAPFARGETGMELLGYPVMRSLLELGRGELAVSHVDVARGQGITGVPNQWDSLTWRILQYYEGRARELAGDTADAIAVYRELIDGWDDAVAEVPLVADAPQRLAALQG
ncbi:MAG: hypothetical protein R3195_07020 [Gemmatimonadota bacterium]|nr:hypothetical protein [Gemmatimonadota bacterium]